MVIPHSPSDYDTDQDNASVPQRKCVVTGQTADKAALIRFVASPDGQLVADLNEKLGGRGAWSGQNVRVWNRPCPAINLAAI